MQVVPYKSHLQDYEWRFNLQLGSKIDFQDFSGNWIIVTVV